MKGKGMNIEWKGKRINVCIYVCEEVWIWMNEYMCVCVNINGNINMKKGKNEYECVWRGIMNEWKCVREGNICKGNIYMYIKGNGMYMNKLINECVYVNGINMMGSDECVCVCVCVWKGIYIYEREW